MARIYNILTLIFFCLPAVAMENEDSSEKDSIDSGAEIISGTDDEDDSVIYIPALTNKTQMERKKSWKDLIQRTKSSDKLNSKKINIDDDNRGVIYIPSEPTDDQPIISSKSSRKRTSSKIFTKFMKSRQADKVQEPAEPNDELYQTINNSNTFTSLRIPEDLRHDLVTGNMASFETKKKNKSDLKHYRFWAKRGGYEKWAKSINGGSILPLSKTYSSIIKEIELVNCIKRTLFFGAKFADPFRVTKAIQDFIKLRGVYDPNIFYENFTNPYQLASENNYPLLAEYLKSKLSSTEEMEELILEEILKENNDKLIAGQMKDKANLLSWFVINNLSDLARNKYKDTILAWLVKENFTFRFNVGTHELLPISIDEKIWDSVNRTILLFKKDFYFLKRSAKRVNNILLGQVAKAILENHFLENLKRIDALIEQGLELNTEFDTNKYGKKTLADLAACMDQKALAIALKDRVLWELFRLSFI